jgi:7-carboxy-7-deazaguanine synthase
MGQEKSYALAPQGVFWTVQGEGLLAGTPMVFVRLAGCSVGCPGCDTDYSVASRASAAEIANWVACEMTANTAWVWLTGGEPLDRDLFPLLSALRRIPGLSIAVATSGMRWPTPEERRHIDFLSVSPHAPGWVLREGDELKVVPGLNGLAMGDLAEDIQAWPVQFAGRFVQPLWGDPASLKQCLEFVGRSPGWRISWQGHKGYSVP